MLHRVQPVSKRPWGVEDNTRESSSFNVSLLIVHCRLRDIVILTIHLFTRFIIIIIIILLIINNNNRNRTLLLQIYRCAACVSLCMYTLCTELVVFFIEKRGLAKL